MLNDVFEMDTEPHVPEVFDYIPEGITVAPHHWTTFRPNSEPCPCRMN
jgi:hypothetical protein